MENLTFDFEHDPPKSPATNDEVIALRQFTRKAYLDYSMYVILDRALPSLADGLK